MTQTGRSPKDLTANAAATKLVHTMLLNTSFDGASGKVQFDPATGDRLGLTIVIRNQVDGVETTIARYQEGAFTPASMDIAWWFNLTSGNKSLSSGVPRDRSPLQPPYVLDIAPRVSSPLGETLTITGRNFRAGVIVVTVADRICTGPVLKSNTRIVCKLPPGVGGPHHVVVSCNGIPSKPRRLLSYFLPHINQLSKSWVADGSFLRVTGSNFIRGTTRCRVKGYSESLAKVVDDSHIECHISLPENVDKGGALEKLEVSNDGGQRWVSGLTIQTPVEWGGGALVPVSPRTQTYHKEVVIGGVIPTDRFADPETAKQFVSDLSLAFKMAAQAVNEANLFPGKIQLRVEILPVDPGGSGSPTTATEVVTAFAKQGVAVNASTPVGVHDPSKCIEFGFPIHSEWQDDPECCSVHAKAGCSGGYNKVKGGICGSGSWGVAHETKCESTANPHPLTNIIGIVGLHWSSNAISVARAVSNPFRLPTIGVDPWTSVLDNATEFPFFIRVCPSNSEISKVCGVFMRSMGWSRIAIVTDDDAFSSDFGKQVANDMNENGGTVIYHGVYPKVPSEAVVDKQGQLHVESVKTISNHLSHARAKGARIVFVVAKGDAGKIALYSALEATGFLNEGNAVMVSLPRRSIFKLNVSQSFVILSLTLNLNLNHSAGWRNAANDE